MGFVIGLLVGILGCIFIPKFISKHFEFQRAKKEYEVTFTILYYTHPTEITKKGEYIRMKPIRLRLRADDDEEAVDFTKEIIHDNIKIEIDSIEEVDGQ